MIRRLFFTRRYFTQCALAVIVVGLLLTCPVLAQPIVLDHWDWHEGRSKLVNEWAQVYADQVKPGFELESVVVPHGEFLDKLMLAIVSGTAPDLTQFHNEYYSALEGLLAPFPDDVFNYDQMANDYFLFEDAFLFDGQMYFFPAGIMTAGLFYNVDHLSAAGIDKPGASWSEVIEQGKKLTRHDGEVMSRAGLQILGAATWVYTDLIYQQGGLLFSDDGANFLTPEAMQAADLFLQIHNAEIGPSGNSPSPGEFHTGQVSLRYEWLWLNADLEDFQTDVHYEVARIPTFTGESAPAVGRNNYEAGIAVPYNVAEDRQREAFEFIHWLYDQDEFYIELNRMLGRIPGRYELWSHPDLVEQSAFRMLSEQAIYTVYPGPIPSWYFETGMAAWHSVFAGGINPVEALQKAQVTADARWKDEPARFIIESAYEAP